MSGNWFTHAKYLIANQQLNFETVGVFCALLDEDSLVLSSLNAATVSAIGTLSEFDGPDYARLAVTGEDISEDAANKRAKFDCDNVDFGNQDNGSARIKYALFYSGTISPAQDGTNIPIIVLTRSEGPEDPGGGNVTVTPSASGLGYF